MKPLLCLLYLFCFSVPSCSIYPSLPLFLTLSTSYLQGCTAFSPYNVMYSGWMGDDDSSFLGLRACAHKVPYTLHVAYIGYYLLSFSLYWAVVLR